jgi:hypothetical protein
MFIAKARIAPPQRRFVQEPSDDGFWQTIHRIADKYYVSLRRMITQFWDRWRELIDYPHLFDNLLGNNIPAATSVVEHAWMEAENELITDLQPELSRVAEESFSATTKVQIGTLVGVASTRDIQEWTRQRIGEWITQIGQTERDGIRQVILDGMRKGMRAEAIARDVRQFIGLTKPQADTISRLRATMEHAGIPGRKIEDALAKRARRMIRERATVIARNETIIASKAGSYLAWMEAAYRGEIDLNTARRFWVITPLDACSKCLPIPGMNPKGRRLDEPFMTPRGALMSAHVHIQCRCVETVRL